ncbi:dihydrofolate reductase family protein [Flavitalea antarctica]
MRKVILGVAVSLDGYIEGPNGEYDWCFTDQDYGLNEFFTRVDTIFIGRKSYEMALQYTNDNNGEMVPGMPRMTEYVFSDTLKNVKEGAILVSGDSLEQARKVKQLAGKDIWLFGGASLTDSLMKEGLVDELWLSVHPILLGTGKPLFRQQENRTNLTLIHSKTYETGLVSLRYAIGDPGK